MSIAPHNKDDTHRHSEFGIAATCVGCAMLVVQLAVLSAVVLGVKDNQGVIYAVAIPFFTFCIGVPVGLVLACIGFAQARRHRKYAKIGLRMTLAGPFLFAIFIAIQMAFHPW